MFPPVAPIYGFTVKLVIHLLVAAKHLRAGILYGATERAKQLARLHEGGRAKVYELDVKGLVENDILVLDVAVQDVEAVKVVHGRHNLRQHTNKQACRLFTMESVTKVPIVSIVHTSLQIYAQRRQVPFSVQGN